MEWHNRSELDDRSQLGGRISANFHGDGDVQRSDSLSPTINTAVATGSLLFTGTASQNFSGGNTLTLNGVGGVGINNQVNYAPTFANPITLGASRLGRLRMPQEAE